MQKKPFWHYFLLMFSLHYSYGTFSQEELFGSRTEEMKSLNDCYLFLSSLVAQLVKNLPAMQETPVQFLGGEDLLEKG